MSPRLPRITLSVSVLALLATCIPDVAPLLIYNREAIAHGELWRLVTCHLPHSGPRHLFWDLLPFCLLGGLLERHNDQAYIDRLLLATLLIPVGVYLLLPGCPYLHGLSGIVYTLALLLAREELERRRSSRSLLPLLFCLAMLISVLIELVNGYPLFRAPTGVSPLPGPLCHLIGALIGCSPWHLSSLVQKEPTHVTC